MAAFRLKLTAMKVFINTIETNVHKKCAVAVPSTGVFSGLGEKGQQIFVARQRGAGRRIAYLI